MTLMTMLDASPASSTGEAEYYRAIPASPATDQRIMMLTSARRANNIIEKYITALNASDAECVPS